MSSITIIPAKRARRPQRHLEDAESVFLMQWAGRVRLEGARNVDPTAFVLGSTVSDYLIHIPNGGKRDPREAARLRSMGVKAGVSDYLLPLPTMRRPAMILTPGLWLELKAGKGKPSEAQLHWQNMMALAGYSTGVATGWVAAARMIVAYLGLPSSTIGDSLPLRARDD